MKLENRIKQSLNNHEEAYNPAAWDAMKAKLDAKYPISPKSGNGKWWFAAGILAVIATSIFIWNNSNSNTTEIATKSQENTISKEEGRKQNNPKTNLKSTSTNKLEVQSVETKSIDNKPESLVKNSDGLQAQNSTDQIGRTKDNNFGNQAEPNLTDPIVQKTNTVKQGDRIEPNLENTKFKLSINNLCLGSNQIKNIDSRTMVVLDDNKRTIAKIQGNHSENVEISKSGMIHIGHKVNGKYKNVKSIKIEEISEIFHQQIDDDIKFENGLPVVKFISDDKLTWSAKGQKITGKEAEFHFYQQGNQTIKLTKNVGKCSASKVISVPVEKYNLLAPTAFNPNGFNKTFIPEALKLRNIDFRMTIIDMSNGGLVYETSNANLPWDGVDIRTGQIAKDPIKYAWKVQIMNPEPGEPELYQGKIQKL